MTVLRAATRLDRDDAFNLNRVAAPLPSYVMSQLQQLRQPLIGKLQARKNLLLVQPMALIEHLAPGNSKHIVVVGHRRILPGAAAQQPGAACGQRISRALARNIRATRAAPEHHDAGRQAASLVARVARFEPGDDPPAVGPELPRRVVQNHEARHRQQLVALLHVFEQVLAPVILPPIGLVHHSRVFSNRIGADELAGGQAQQADRATCGGWLR